MTSGRCWVSSRTDWIGKQKKLRFIPENRNTGMSREEGQKWI